MAVMYLKAAGGNFSAAGSWSATGSGGGDSVGPPTAATDVILELGSGQLTIDAASACRSFDCTSGTGTYAGTITHNAFTLSIGDATAGAGNVALKLRAATYTLANAATSAISFVSTSTTQQTISTNGLTLGNVVINGAGSSYLLSDALITSGSWTKTTGAVDLNSQTLTLNGAARTFTGGSATYSGTVVLSGSGVATIAGANTFTTLTRAGTSAKTDALTLSGDQTVSGTCTLTGQSVTNRLIIQSSTVGTARTLSAATWAVTNSDFMDITAANSTPMTGTSLGNALGNSDITFDTPVTRYAVAAGNWSSTGTWSATNGGSSGATVPLPQDTVYVNNGSGVGTITMDMPRLGASLDCTGAGGGTAYTGTLSGTISIALYGSFALHASMTAWTFATSSTAMTFAGRSSHSITSAGKTLTAGSASVAINGPTSTYTLQDALTLSGSGTLTIANGTFTTADFSIITPRFAIGTGTKTMNGGLSSISLIDTAAATILTTTAAGSTLNVSSTTWTVTTSSANTRSASFSATSFNWGTFTYALAGSTGQLSFTGNATFNTLNFSDASNARTLQFGSTTTITIVTTFNVNGTAGKLMTVQSSSAGSAATLSKSSGIVNCDYLSIKDSTASGGASFYADNSTNVSGNTGWSFTKALAALAASLALAAATALLALGLTVQAGASVGLTGGTPTLDIGLAPAAGAATLAPATPVLDQGLVVIGGSLGLSGGLPTVEIPTVLEPAGASLTLTGATPTVVGEGSYVPTTGALALVGGTSTVDLGLVPAAGSLALVGETPSLAIGPVILPTGATLTLDTGTPVLDLGLVASGGSLAGTGTAPVIDLGLVPAGSTLGLTGGTPAVVLGVVVAPSAGALTLTGATPALEMVVQPTGGSLGLTGGTPTLDVSRLLQPAGASASLTGGTPTVAFVFVLQPTGGSLALTGGTPEVSVSFALIVGTPWQVNTGGVLEIVDVNSSGIFVGS